MNCSNCGSRLCHGCVTVSPGQKTQEVILKSWIAVQPLAAGMLSGGTQCGDSKSQSESLGNQIKTPHKWAKEIICWANGEIIQHQRPNELFWFTFSRNAQINWGVEGKFRVRPEVDWPGTSLTQNELFAIINEYQDHKGTGFIMAANAAIRRAIEDEQVIIAPAKTSPNQP